MILYSILLPAFKGEFLADAIDSVLRQDYDRWELIIIDDASPDNLAAIVKPYLADDRIRFYRNDVGCGAENVVDNWNKCLSHATGEYVMCMGDDDLLMPYCLSEFDALIARCPDHDVYHTRLAVIDRTGSVVSEQPERPLKQSAYDMLWNKWQGQRQALGDWLFDTARLKEMGGFVKFPYGWASDDITAAAMARQCGIANCNVFCYGYRLHSAALTSNHDRDATMGKITAWQAVDEWLKQWLSIAPNDAGDRPTHDKLCAIRERYIAGRMRGDLYNGIKKSPCSLWYYLSHVTCVPKLIIIAIWVKRLLH